MAAAADCRPQSIEPAETNLPTAGAPVDCNTANACAHRCVPGAAPGHADRCECFTGYKLAADGVSCADIDECKLNLHTCSRHTEICDNTRGSFRCLARGTAARHSAAEVEAVSAAAGGPLDEQQPKFASMRLCPPNNSWNAIEQQCQPTAARNNNNQAGGSAHVSNSHSFRQSHLSYSLASVRRRSVV